MRIGVLALQGAFEEHKAMFKRLGCDVFEIRQLSDIEKPFDALVLPGGESTVITKLLHDTGLFEPLHSMIKHGLPTFGTCAGLILLARNVEGGDECFALMDIDAKRNAYGRQLGSFRTEQLIPAFSDREIPLIFIRAPYISRAGDDVEILCEVNERIAAARKDNMLVTAFHPELTNDDSTAKYFLNEIISKWCDVSIR